MSSKRIYEGLYEPFPNEPTSDRFQLVETDTKGQGVMSLAHFNKGDVVFAFRGRIQDHQSLMTLDLQNGNPSVFVA